MKQKQQIEQRQEYLNGRISSLSKRLKQLLLLPFSNRNQVYTQYLRDELNTYQYALDQINWVLSDLKDEFKNKCKSEPHASYFPPAQPFNSALFTLSTKQNLYLYITGGIGDVLCATPLLKGLRTQYQDLKIHLLLDNTSRIELFEHNNNVNSVSTIASHNNKRQPVITLSVGNLGTDVYYRTHASKILASALNVEITDTVPEIFLTEAEISQAKQFTKEHSKLVVIGAVSRQPPNQNWPTARWEALIDLCTDITFIQLGLPDEPPIKGAIDFRSKGKIRDSIALLKVADAYIGMDTFWAHASAAVNTPGVVLFGGTHPSVFNYPNNIALYENLRCSPCHHRLQGNTCPYNVECINNISVEQVSDALHKQLKQATDTPRT